MSKKSDKETAWAWEGFASLTPTEKVCSVIDEAIANAKDVDNDLHIPTIRVYIKQLQDLKKKFQKGEYQVYERGE